MTPTTFRLFLGVPLDPEAAEEVQRGADALEAANFPGRIVPRENWHLTLRFLGDSSAEQTSTIVQRCVREDWWSPFIISLRGWGAFPKVGRANVLWIGVEDFETRLARLAAAAERAARAAGYQAEDRPFRPHLTVARMRHPTDLRTVLALLPPVSVALRIDRLVLFRSTLGASHPRYEAMHEWALQGDSDRHESL
jgi:RNA 2',3'-cyclic 3'-phosphodiesterase